MKEAEKHRWKARCDQLLRLEALKIPRSFVLPAFRTVQAYQLHYFVDASQVGLKLTVEVIAARMDCKLCEELCQELEESVFWSGSTLVLKYLFNLKACYQPFVVNHVNLIHEVTPSTAWRYVDIAKTLADLALEKSMPTHC
ncbi:uncharacterized protein LOC135218777 [Macrobrachium nipponense]|uniref:uncharacterized protein LOC135218777 n=1 Tax=Macrobrachium nipponense TaxID=159736 RepID=UPI0030C86F20